MSTFIKELEELAIFDQNEVITDAHITKGSFDIYRTGSNEYEVYLIHSEESGLKFKGNQVDTDNFLKQYA